MPETYGWGLITPAGSEERQTANVSMPITAFLYWKVRLPWGSVLSPLLFFHYIQPLGDLTQFLILSIIVQTQVTQKCIPQMRLPSLTPVSRSKCIINIMLACL